MEMLLEAWEHLVFQKTFSAFQNYHEKFELKKFRNKEGMAQDDAILKAQNNSNEKPFMF